MTDLTPSSIPPPPTSLGAAPPPPPAEPGETPSKKVVASHERIWGKRVVSHGYAGVPSILLRAQSRLGVSPLQFAILVQLLDYWRDPERAPFPSKLDLASRIGVKPKTIQLNMAQLEKAGLVKRELRRSAFGDWTSNVYHLDGLIAKIQGFEPEFQAERERREAERRRMSTPRGRRLA